MISKLCGVVLVGVGLMVAGCGKEEAAPAPTTAAPTAATPAAPAAASPTPSVATPTQAPKEAAPLVTASENAVSQTESVKKAAIAQAETLLTTATQYIKDHKLELADKALTQLEGMKSSLPTEYQSKMDALRLAINAAKASGMQLPGGLKL